MHAWIHGMIEEVMVQEAGIMHEPDGLLIIKQLMKELFKSRRIKVEW
jgi:hypothetical protein